MEAAIAVVVLACVSAGAVADQTVRGYVRKDGTYVAPHVRSSPNQHRFDNYSSSGNSNPYTGQRGYDRNEFTDPPAFNKPQPLYQAPSYSSSNIYGDPYRQPRNRY
jgi:hypothetical protein